MTRPLVVIGHPEHRRVRGVQDALRRLGRPPARVVSYRTLFARRMDLSGLCPRGAIVRIESPGENPQVEHALIALGAEAERAGRAPPPRSADEFGRIYHPRMWFAGFRALMSALRAQLDARPDLRVMTSPAEILAMTDKRAAYRRLCARGVDCPRRLGPVTGYDELRRHMRESGHSRVFVKLRYGSSAVGVVALTATPRGQRAITSTCLVPAPGGGCHLYSARQVQRYERVRDIRALIEALAGEHIVVEEWLPKASLGDERFDVRVVVIAGRARHCVARLSGSPMTNLQLGSRRGDLDRIIGAIGVGRWRAVRRCAESALAAFPDALYAGVDVAVTPSGRCAVLEVNAFGDLLPQVLDAGDDTYTAQVRALDVSAR